MIHNAEGEVLELQRGVRRGGTGALMVLIEDPDDPVALIRLRLLRARECGRIPVRRPCSPRSLDLLR